MDRIFLSRNEAAIAMSISLRFLDALISDGRIDHVKVGKRTLIPLGSMKQLGRNSQSETAIPAQT